MRRIILLFISLICCSGGGRSRDTVLALVSVEYPQQIITRHTKTNNLQSRLPRTIITTTQLLSTTSTKEMALQLMEENAMPLYFDTDDVNNNDELSLQKDILQQNNHYDEEDVSPTETEFMGLINTFKLYTEKDIQSLSSTSTRYHNYKVPTLDLDEENDTTTTKRYRSKEDGIRYRTLYSGVQAASTEYDIIHAFIILFEDYLPIRIAGRRIYKHLNNVMDEVREERLGEMRRVHEICPSWNDISVSVQGDNGKVVEQNVIDYARYIWDTLMDETLLLKHSLDDVPEEEQSLQEGGVISLSQLVELGIDKVMIQEGIIRDAVELESIMRSAALQEEAELESYYNPKKRRWRGSKVQNEDDEKYMDMTFPIFMKVLYECMQLREEGCNIPTLLQKMEMRISEHHTASGFDDKDISTLLAEKAVLSGSSSSCKKRRRFSDRFDEFVSTFQLWETKFLQHNKGSNAGSDDVDKKTEELQQEQTTRRFEILKGCFVGARNERNVAALKIVYMDYAALRVGGDLIFSLMSKIADKIM